MEGVLMNRNPTLSSSYVPVLWCKKLPRPNVLDKGHLYSLKHQTYMFLSGVSIRYRVLSVPFLIRVKPLRAFVALETSVASCDRHLLKLPGAGGCRCRVAQ
jgi:hypothetical protein